MGSVEKTNCEIVKFERWGIVKRYPGRSELVFMSEDFEQVHQVWKSLYQVYPWGDDAFSIDLVRIVEERD